MSRVHVAVVNHHCHQAVKVHGGAEGHTETGKGQHHTWARSSPSCFVFRCSFFLEQIDALRDTLPCNYFSVQQVSTLQCCLILFPRKPFILRVYAIEGYCVLHSIICNSMFHQIYQSATTLFLKHCYWTEKLLQKTVLLTKKAKLQQVTHDLLQPEKGDFEFCLQQILLPWRNGAKENHQKSAKRKASISTQKLG